MDAIAFIIAIWVVIFVVPTSMALMYFGYTKRWCKKKETAVAVSPMSEKQKTERNVKQETNQGSTVTVINNVEYVGDSDPNDNKRVVSPFTKHIYT